MLVNFIIVYSNHTILIVGVIAAVAGLISRKSPERDYLIYADGFQGAAITTLLFASYMLFYTDDPKSLAYIKEKADTIILLMVLTAILFLDKLIRSMKS